MKIREYWHKLVGYKDKLYVTGWILKQLKGLRWMTVGIAAASVISSLLSVWFALYTRNAVDDAVNGNAAMLKKDLLILVVMIVAILICTALSSWWEDRFTQIMNKRLRKYYFEKVLDSEFEAVSKYHSGDLLNRITNDVGNLSQGVLQILTTLVTVITSVIAAGVVLVDMSPQILLILLAVSAVLCFGVFLTHRYVMALTDRISAANGRVTSYFQEMINKLMIIKALDAVFHVKRHSEELLSNHLQTQRKRTFFNVSLNTGFSLIAFVISFISMWWSLNHILAGEITYGDMTAITQLATKIETPFYAVPTLLLKYFSMLASGERLQVIEKFPMPQQTRECDVQQLYRQAQGIKAESLSYGYDDNLILRDISFTIPKEGITVVTGTSGVGKSTLLKLMMGLYQPNEGKLILCGSDNASLGWDTRKLFSYAPQGNLLISGTILDNLLLVRPDASKEEINQAVYISDMDAYLKDLPQGLNTKLGENGAGLSEGQAQRLSLARAILSDAPILLLDEITSALDEEAEELVLKRLRQLKDRTCIVVTHRRTVLELADYRLHITEDSAKILPLHQVEEVI